VGAHLHPFRHTKIQTPDVGGEDVRFDARDLSLSVVFTGLYVVINVVQMLSPFGNPSIYGPVQLRVADFLIAFAALLGLPVVAGVTVGCVLTNAFGPVGPVDVVFGSIANLIAAGLVMVLHKRRLLACIVGALPIGVIVGGGYLWLFFSPPDVFGLNLPAWAAMMVSVTISSLIAIAVIGYILLTVISRPSIIEPLKSHGLKVLS